LKKKKEEKQRGNFFGEGLSNPIKFMISRIQFVFAGLKRRKKEGSIKNPFLFKGFNLGRYILANLERCSFLLFWD